jgi:hypothetical protein
VSEKKPSNGGGAAVGNQYGVILKDPAIRQKAYDSFCAHIALGKSIRSWWFEEDGHRCCWYTMTKYIKNEEEFDPVKKSIAQSKGYYHWEQVAEDSATGINKDANTASLQMVMRNKFGWDRVDEKEIGEENSDILRAHETVAKAVKDLQEAYNSNKGRYVVELHKEA